MSSAWDRHERALEALHDEALATFGPAVAADVAGMIEQARTAAAAGDKTAHTWAMVTIRGRLRQALAERGDSAEDNA